MTNFRKLKLHDELETLKKHGMEVLPQDVIEAFEQSIQDLRDSGAAKGLSVGAVAPDFTLVNQAGESITLSEKLLKGPVIITFYRGEWCPFCNLELRAYQRIMDDIHEAGADLLAISPMTPDHSLTIQEKNGLDFHVLSDLNNQVAEKYRLQFKLPEELQSVYRTLGFALDQFNGDDSWQLPVPATFIVDQQGIIRFADVNPDYKVRAEPSEVLSKLLFI
ncbi:peroxiredoxin-like family protein [Paenibacillus ihbetae]|nr:peroxiredoxin-like family protein [Paenibacillus ihbetae]